MKLSLKEKVGYALGDTASNFYWKSFEFFLLIFYTDVFGLSPVVAGTMFGATRIFDALIDPVMGTIADRTRSRWGHFRPYLLWMALPLAVAGVLTFSTPHLDTRAKIFYAYATYNLMMLAYTAINIPYSALMGVTTSDTQERTSLSSWRFIGGFSGGVIVTGGTQWLVKVLGGASVERGWQLAMVVWGVLAGALFVVCFLTTKERVAPPVEQEADLRRELGDLLGNVPWVVMCLVGVVTLTAFITRSQSTAYFFKYYVRDESLTKIAITTGMLAGILGVALVPPLTRLAGGKRNLFATLMAVSGALTVVFYFLPPTSPGLLIAFNILIVFIQGGNSPLVWAMYADTADHGEWKNGRRNTGLIFSAATMSQKGGGALAGLLNGLFLAAFGYVANAQQTARSLMGIRVTMSLIPGILCMAAAALMVFYKLDDRTMKTIEGQLLDRRANHPPPAVSSAAAALPGPS